MDIRILGLLVLVLLFSGCGGASTLNTQTGNEDTHKSLNNSPTITVEMTMLNLPEQLEFNRFGTQAGQLEYHWGMSLDVNDDGIVNAGDLRIALFHYKLENDAALLAAPTYARAALFEHLSNGGYAVVLDVIPVSSQSENTLRLTLSKSAHTSLENLPPTTRVYFSTEGMTDSGDRYADFYPAEETYAEMSADGRFEDEIDPRSLNSEAMKKFLGLEIDDSAAQLDMVSMRVTIEEQTLR